MLGQAYLNQGKLPEAGKEFEAYLKIAPNGPNAAKAKSNAEIFRLLAAAFGFDDPQFKLIDMELAEHYVKWDAPQMAGVDMEYFRRHCYEDRCLSSLPGFANIEEQLRAQRNTDSTGCR